MAELVANAPSETSRQSRPVAGWLGKAVVAALFVAFLWVSWSLYALGEPVLAVLVLAAAVGFAIIFGAAMVSGSYFSATA